VNIKLANLGVRFANSTPKCLKRFVPIFCCGEPAGTRTQDPVIKSHSEGLRTASQITAPLRTGRGRNGHFACICLMGTLAFPCTR
jgi:hypothetical protein